VVVGRGIRGDVVRDRRFFGWRLDSKSWESDKLLTGEKSGVHDM
jgi:hypothetical protein